jgi:uncharacterized protein YmfQ (DUF2313 family)
LIKSLFSYLPAIIYKNSKVVKDLFSPIETEISDFETKLESVLNQFFVDTADFTLERWEKELGLEVNNSYNTDFRRSRIKAKLRGQGTVTIKLIENVAESFSNGDVEVIEDNSNYRFIVKFVGILGIPPNMNDLEKAIEDIKPAHLGFTFEYTYNTYESLNTRTHNSLGVLTNDEIKIHKF